MRALFQSMSFLDHADDDAADDIDHRNHHVPAFTSPDTNLHAPSMAP